MHGFRVVHKNLINSCATKQVESNVYQSLYLYRVLQSVRSDPLSKNSSLNVSPTPKLTNTPPINSHELKRQVSEQII